jgi:hypothetical protein
MSFICKMGHWVRRIYLPNCSGDGRWSCSTKVTPRMLIHFHTLDAKPLTTLEQVRKLSAQKSGGESWGSKITTYFSTIFHWACNTCPTLLRIEHLSKEIGYPRVLARWYSPFGTRGPQKVQTQWCACETPVGPLAMSLTWLGVVNCACFRSVVLPRTRVKKDLG